MKFYQPGVSFASGELTPTLAARVDLSAYNIGAKEITNFLVLPQGGLINRPGTRRLANRNGQSQARLIPFVFNASTAYCLVYMPDGTVYVYRSDGTYLTGFAGYAYTAAELREIRTLQSADIMYVFHHNHPTQKIMRKSGCNWSMEAVIYKNGPYMDFGYDPVFPNSPNASKFVFRITSASKNYATGESTGNVNCNYNVMRPAHVGHILKLEVDVPAGAGAADNLTDGKYTDSVEPFGSLTVKSGGTWTGTVTIYRMLPDDLDYVAVQTYTSNDDYNLGYQADVDEYGTRYRARYDKGAGGGASVSIDFAWSGGILARQVRITAVSGDISFNAAYESIDGITGTTPKTKRWAWGAFGYGMGYPAMGIFYQERLVLASTPENPRTLWFSKSASWEDFGTSLPLEDTDAITVTLAAKRVDDIVGLAARSELLVFTAGSEWTVKAGARSDVLTPSSTVVTPSGYHGSAAVEPLDVGTMTMYVQRGGKAARGLGYQLDIDGYSSKELSVLSAHLFENNPAVSWCYQQSPWSIVWTVLRNGHVLALTVQQEHQVMAWTRNRFSSNVVDICAVPGAEQDEVFLLTGNNSLSMLQHRSDASFSAAAYLDEGAAAYTSVFESMELEQNVNGSIQGRHKHVPRVTVRVFRTSRFYAGIVNENNAELDQATFPGDVSPGYKNPPYTGDVYLSVPGGFSRQARLRVENRDAAPMTLLGFYSEVEMNEG